MALPVGLDVFLNVNQFGAEVRSFLYGYSIHPNFIEDVGAIASCCRTGILIQLNVGRGRPLYPIGLVGGECRPTNNSSVASPYFVARGASCCLTYSFNCSTVTPPQLATQDENAALNILMRALKAVGLIVSACGGQEGTQPLKLRS